MENFNGLGLPADLLENITKLQFKQPTPIQQKAIPIALSGRDILGSAQTGTGKTAAFAIPVITRLMQSTNNGSAIILTPTRELATQVLTAIRSLLGHKIAIRTALLIGGESMPKQFAQLRANPRIIVGTPGRINDHLDRRTLNLSNVEILVLDETDRMLDMGFGIQIDAILKHVPKTKQTMLFSATIPPAIAKIAQRYQNNPERISVAQVNRPAENIQQDVVKLSETEKYPELLRQLETRTGSIIIFAKTKRATENLSAKLSRSKYEVDFIHGDLKQQRRERIMRSFRSSKFRILVATDVASRGLDVPHIEHVINYDLPQCPEDYVHRIGRTARAGAKGSSLCLISPADSSKWRDIQRLLNPDQKFESSNQNDRNHGQGKKSNSNNKFGNKNRRGGRPFSQNSNSNGRNRFKRRGNSSGGNRSFGGGNKSAA